MRFFLLQQNCGMTPFPMNVPLSASQRASIRVTGSFRSTGLIEPRLPCVLSLLRACSQGTNIWGEAVSDQVCSGRSTCRNYERSCTAEQGVLNGMNMPRENIQIVSGLFVDRKEKAESSLRLI